MLPALGLCEVGLRACVHFSSFSCVLSLVIVRTGSLRRQGEFEQRSGRLMAAQGCSFRFHHVSWRCSGVSHASLPVAVGPRASLLSAVVLVARVGPLIVRFSVQLQFWL